MAAVYSFWRWVGEISLLTASKAAAFKLLTAGLLGQKKNIFNLKKVGRPFPWPNPKRWDTSFWAWNNRSTSKPLQAGLNPLRFIYLSRRQSIRAVKGNAYPPPPPSPRNSLVRPISAFLSQKQCALHFAGCTEWFTKEGGQADICNIGLTEL